MTNKFIKLFFLRKSFKDFSLIIRYAYYSVLLRFNDLFVLFNYLCRFFRFLYFFRLFNSSDSTTSFMMIDSNNFFFISSFDSRFVLLLSSTPFHTYKQKIINGTNLQQKCFSKLIFASKLVKELPHLQRFFLFHILLFHIPLKVSSINSLVSGNLL